MSAQKVLIVDDEPAIRALLRCAIAGPDFRVFEADCGAAAVSIAAQQAPFALVVSDILMPGMDGIELAKAMARDGQAERFLFISGYCDATALPASGRDFPTSAFLAKPFSISELLKVFRELMGEKPQAVREVSVRESHKKSALRRPASPIDAVRALRRKVCRLRVRRDELMRETVAGLHTHGLLMKEIGLQFAAIQSIDRTLSRRRAML